ncbi:MAG: SRPBCC family protein [Acidobacteriota bacterium]|nr:SRPBCC family protein [Acidobacteriota bacterium]
MRHTFQVEQWLPYPVEFVFSFFANPENLPRLMPRWQRARIEEAAFTSPPPMPPAPPGVQRLPAVAAGPGTRMTLSLRPFPFAPIRLPWEAEIPEFVWDDHFCDIQLRGPFAYWRHCHFVAAARHPESGAAGCTVRDHIEYELPLGLLGDLAHRLFVRAQLRSTFAYRHARTQEMLARAAASMQRSA